MDSAEVSVTHQIRINREDSWVKVSVSLDRYETEKIQDTIDRASRIVNKKVIDTIQETVQTVQQFERKN